MDHQPKGVAFWLQFRNGLIVQWRACSGWSGAGLPDGLADGILALIRTVERHASLPPFDPYRVPARQRRGEG